MEAIKLQHVGEQKWCPREVIFTTQIGAASTQGRCVVNAGIRKYTKVANKVLYLLDALKMIERCEIRTIQMARGITNGIGHVAIVATL
eukprot:6879541-Ditylum_brightwellii.AAC.1